MQPIGIRPTNDFAFKKTFGSPENKLSILDIRAVDQRGAIYDVEMQLSTQSGLVKRIVFYGCEV